MIKETITYTDFDGKERTEEIYFNLTKTELTKMQVSEADGLDVVLTKMIEDDNQQALLEFLDKFIVKAYGIKSDDGRKFIKNNELTEGFIQSAAYDELFMNLVTNPDKLTAFVKGILPSDTVSMIESSK